MQNFSNIKFFNKTSSIIGLVLSIPQTKIPKFILTFRRKIEIFRIIFNGSSMTSLVNFGASGASPRPHSWLPLEPRELLPKRYPLDTPRTQILEPLKDYTQICACNCVHTFLSTDCSFLNFNLHGSAVNFSPISQCCKKNTLLSKK